MSMLGLFYRGRPPSWDIYSATFNGSVWAGDTDISNQPGGINPMTDVALAACLYNNRLYVAYKGWSGTDIYLSVFDGTTWFGDRRISDLPGGISPMTDAAPTLIV
jgi:hypothetical protein